MFKALSPSEVSVLVDALHETRYVTGDKIIKQGDEGDTFYIVKSGRVRVSVQGNNGQEKEIAKRTPRTQQKPPALPRRTGGRPSHRMRG